jgi:hypothetical protein
MLFCVAPKKEEEEEEEEVVEEEEEVQETPPSMTHVLLALSLHQGTQPNPEVEVEWDQRKTGQMTTGGAR